MPYLPEDEEQRQQGVTGGSAVAGTGVRPTQPETGSGSWTNLQSYLDLNKPGAEQMAGKIGAGIEQQRQQYGQAVGQAEKGYGDYLKGLEQTAKGKEEWAGRVAEGWTPSPKEIQEQVTGGLFQTGATPEQFSGQYPELQAQRQSLAERLGRTATESGRMQELKGIQGPQTTRGETLLN